MRVLVASTAIALLFGLSPASAMCGSGQQAGAAVCGAAKPSKQMSEMPDASKQSGMKMCGCCKDMAMMGGMKSDDPHKGMNMPR